MPTNHTRRRFLHVAGGAAVLGSVDPAAAAPAAATPLRTGEGTGTIQELEVIPLREAGGNSFQDRILRGTVTGDLVGRWEQQTSGMVHKSGRVVFRGRMTFEGTVATCGEGTITLGVSGRGHVETPGFPVTEGTVRVINQADNTVDVTGTGTVSQEGPTLAYSIQYRCR